MLVAALLMASAAQAEVKPARPNVVLIMADDMGAECVGCYGGSSYKTPRIDALAATGMRFENAFSMPLCGPTRACILSGRYPFRSGVAANQGLHGFEIPWGRGKVPEVTFAHLLQKQGYATAIAGKWALCQFDKSPHHMTDCGFEHYSMWPKIYQRKQTKRYWDPACYQDGKLLPRIKGTFGPDHECNYLIEFMRQNKDRPFLAYYPMTLVHSPLELPPGADKSGKRDKQSKFNLNIQYVDRLVGRIVDAVDEGGLTEKTLIIFTCDNGTSRGYTSRLEDRDIQGGKGQTSDAGTRVPFVARWTGTIKPGGTCTDLIDFSDILPTLAELAGARPPTDRIIDGRSFAPQLHGRAGSPREWVYLQNGNSKIVRGKRWQLNQSGELFDLADRYQPALVKSGQEGDDAQAARKRLVAILKNVRSGTAGSVKD